MIEGQTLRIDASQKGQPGLPFVWVGSIVRRSRPNLNNFSHRTGCRYESLRVGHPETVRDYGCILFSSMNLQVKNQISRVSLSGLPSLPLSPYGLSCTFRFAAVKVKVARSLRKVPLYVLD